MYKLNFAPQSIIPGQKLWGVLLHQLMVVFVYPQHPFKVGIHLSAREAPLFESCWQGCGRPGLVKSVGIFGPVAKGGRVIKSTGKSCGAFDELEDCTMKDGV